MATDASALIRSLQIIGTTVAALKAGHGFAESFCFGPIITKTSDRARALTLFRKVYESGMAAGLSSIATGTLSFGYIAYSLYDASQSSPWKYYAASSALMAGMIPATLLMVIPVVHRLIEEEEKSEDTRKLSEREVKELIGSWGVRNVIRQCLPLAASVVAAYAGLCL